MDFRHLVWHGRMLLGGTLVHHALMRVKAALVDIVNEAEGVCAGHCQVSGLSAAQDVESGGSGGADEAPRQRSAPAFTSAECSLSACIVL